MDLKVLQGLHDQFAEIFFFLLPVVNSVPEVLCLADENVENGEDLAVVWDESLPDEVLSLGACVSRDEALEHLEHLDDDFLFSCVEGRFDWNNELGDDREDLVEPFRHHVVHSLGSEEAVRLLELPEAIKKDGEVVVEVELLDTDLPGDAVVNTSVVHLYGQVASLVEAPEFCVGGVGALGIGREVLDPSLRNLLQGQDEGGGGRRREGLDGASGTELSHRMARHLYESTNTNFAPLYTFAARSSGLPLH